MDVSSPACLTDIYLLCPQLSALLRCCLLVCTSLLSCFMHIASCQQRGCLPVISVPARYADEYMQHHRLPAKLPRPGMSPACPYTTGLPLCCRHHHCRCPACIIAAQSSPITCHWGASIFLFLQLDFFIIIFFSFSYSKCTFEVCDHICSSVYSVHAIVFVICVYILHSSPT